MGDLLIKDCQEQMGLTNQEMADAMGVALGTYEKWKAGTRKSAAPRRLAQLLAYLHTNHPRVSAAALRALNR